jgi:hypothetical protein
MSLHHRDAFNASTRTGRNNFHYLALLALVGARDYNNLIVAFDVKFRGHKL